MWTNITCENPFDTFRLRIEGATQNMFCETCSHHNIKYETRRGLKVKRYFNPFLKQEKNPFLFHSSYYRYCTNRYAINITTVYDFIYEFYRHDIKGIVHKIQKKKAVMHSNGILCISENTKKDLQKIYPKYNGLIKVVYCGYDTKSFYYEPHEKKKLIISIGDRRAYKRFDLTIKIVKALTDCRLIIVGGGKLTKEEKTLLDEEIPFRYEKMGYLSNDELRHLYSKAFFLSYCSDYEGFGIPIIEAQACGCPVVCQPKASIPEVARGSAIYIDSNNMKTSINKIKQLYDENYYGEIVSRGLENVKRFSWEKCREEVISFYLKVFESKKADSLRGNGDLN